MFGPTITGRVVLPVSNAMSQNLRLAKEQWVKKGRELIQNEEFEYESWAEANPDTSSSPSSASSAPPKKTLNNEQLQGLSEYYSITSASDSSHRGRVVPTHLAIDLYGVDCPLASSLFAFAANLLRDGGDGDTKHSPAAAAARSTDAQSQNSQENPPHSQSFASSWIVSSIIPGHCAVFEHAAIVAAPLPDPTFPLADTKGIHHALYERMAGLGKLFVGNIGSTLTGDNNYGMGKNDNSSDGGNDQVSHLLPRLVTELMRKETARVSSEGPTKPSLGSVVGSVAVKSEARRSIDSRAGLVFLVRSNKAAAIINTNTNDADDEDCTAASAAADDSQCASVGAAAFTILITLSNRTSLVDLLGSYVESGNAFLVGEVAMEAPAALQPQNANNNNNRQRLVFPSLGALWLQSGISLSVPTTMRAGLSPEESLSRIFGLSREKRTTNKTAANDEILEIVTDVWDMYGVRPNRLLRVREADLSNAIVHPLTLLSGVAVQNVAVAVSWRLLLSDLASQIEEDSKAAAASGDDDDALAQQHTAIEGSHRTISMVSISFAKDILDHLSQPRSSASVVCSSSGSRGDLVPVLPRELLTRLSESLSLQFAKRVVLPHPRASSSSGVLDELYLLSSDDEASLAAEGLTSTSVAEEEAAAALAATGVSGGVLSSAALGLSAKELALQVLESTARTVNLGLTQIGASGAAALAPSEKVLFVAKLNPLTTAGGLAACFEQFGRVVSCEVPRDHKTGRSKCYAFVEFETEAAVNAAYSKMGGVMIDNSAIHVDFCQSTKKEEMALLAKRREEARAAREAARRYPPHPEYAGQKRPREGDEGDFDSERGNVPSYRQDHLVSGGGLLPLPAPHLPQQGTSALFAAPLLPSPYQQPQSHE